MSKKTKTRAQADAAFIEAAKNPHTAKTVYKPTTLMSKCVKKHGPKQLCYGCVSRYQNPDKRCSHPPVRDIKNKTWSPVSYCWSYARHIDGDNRFKNMKEICRGCDLWTGKK